MAEKEPISPKENNELFDPKFWQNLIKSDDWNLVKDLMAKHKSYLERQVIICVGSKDHDGAMCYAARANECDVLLQLVSNQLNRKEKKEEV